MEIYNYLTPAYRDPNRYVSLHSLEGTLGPQEAASKCSSQAVDDGLQHHPYNLPRKNEYFAT